MQLMVMGSWRRNKHEQLQTLVTVEELGVLTLSGRVVQERLFSCDIDYEPPQSDCKFIGKWGKRNWGNSKCKVLSGPPGLD